MHQRNGGGVYKEYYNLFSKFSEISSSDAPLLACMANYNMRLESNRFKHRKNNRVPPQKNAHNMQTPGT